MPFTLKLFPCPSEHLELERLCLEQGRRSLPVPLHRLLPRRLNRFFFTGWMRDNGNHLITRCLDRDVRDYDIAEMD